MSLYQICSLLRMRFAIALLCACSVLAHAGNAPPQIEVGFTALYNLEFDRAQRQFAAYQRAYSDDPIGPAAEAAGLLFSEFQRLGVLESQFYTSDKEFGRRARLAPDSAVRQQFDAALARADNLARSRVAKDPADHDGLFALTLTSGLRADYAALIEKRNAASLRYTRESTVWSKQLLAAHPECYDAHLAGGISQYLIGSVAAPVRWLLRLGGISGDKRAGIAELQLAAERGELLAPFARILLAIAYVREKDTPKAIEQLSLLRSEFPANPLFAREIDRLNAE